MVSVSCFGVRVSVVFHFIVVHYTFSSVWVAEWPPFGGGGAWLPVRLAICSHCSLSICNIYLFPALALKTGLAFCNAPVPVHCFSITFLTIPDMLLTERCITSTVL